MKEGTFTSDGPVAGDATGPQQQPQERGLIREQDSTTCFVLRSSAANRRPKRVVDEGWYDAQCIDVRMSWNEHRKRWDAELDFKLLGIPPGLPITKFQSFGENRSHPVLTTRSQLGKFMAEKLLLGLRRHENLRDVFVVEGRVYHVYVVTKRRGKGAECDRPQDEWYSVVKTVADVAVTCASEPSRRGRSLLKKPGGPEMS